LLAIVTVAFLVPVSVAEGVKAIWKVEEATPPGATVAGLG
jgi:hypothetical protein